MDVMALLIHRVNVARSGVAICFASAGGIWPLMSTRSSCSQLANSSSSDAGFAVESLTSRSIENYPREHRYRDTQCSEPSTLY